LNRFTWAGAVAMLSQAGTAVGMFLFVPLGDKYERRSLILLLVIGEFVSLLLMATAQNVLCLGCAAFAVGAFAANVHIVVPFAAHLAAPEQRGRVVGTLVAGILFGVLLARTMSGSIGALLGWRVVYGLGSYLGAWCWHVAGWWGVCGFGTTSLLFALAAEFIYGRRAKN
jgi:predicted MFS family arabinose efflux permease